MEHHHERVGIDASPYRKACFELWLECEGLTLTTGAAVTGIETQILIASQTN